MRCTPAMALGVTNHVWTIEELVTASLGAPMPPPLDKPMPVVGMSAGKAKNADLSRRRALYAIKGGRK